MNNKTTFSLIFTIITIGIILSPFWVSDSLMYVNTFVPNKMTLFGNIYSCFLSILLISCIFHGVYSIYEFIYDWIKKD